MHSYYKQSLFVALAICAFVVLVIYITYNLYQKNKNPSEAHVALLSDDAEVRYINMTGTEVNLEDQLKKSLYINNWASWSPLSRDELIALNEVAGQYSDKNITFIALNRKETKEQAERFLASLPSLTNLTIIIDTTDHFYSQVGGYAMPETVLFNTEGELVKHERTPQTKEQIISLVEELILAEK